MNKTGGLSTSLQLAPGARVIVRVNVHTPDKLVHSANIGTVHSIDFKVSSTIKDGQCTARHIRQVNYLMTVMLRWEACATRRQFSGSPNNLVESG